MVGHSLLNHLQVIEVQSLRHFDPVLAQKAVHFAADRKVFVKPDEIHSVQVFGADVPFVSQRVFGSCRHHHLLLPPWKDGNFAAGLGIADQPQIGPVS